MPEIKFMLLYVALVLNGELIIPQGNSLNIKGALPKLDLQSGVYIITLDDTNDAYIGSTMNHAIRIHIHRDLGCLRHLLN